MNAIVNTGKEQGEDADARNKAHADIVTTKYDDILFHGRRVEGSSGKQYVWEKGKACVNRKEPGQPLKISNNKIESLI